VRSVRRHRASSGAQCASAPGRSAHRPARLVPVDRRPLRQLEPVGSRGLRSARCLPRERCGLVGRERGPVVIPLSLITLQREQRGGLLGSLHPLRRNRARGHARDRSRRESAPSLRRHAPGTRRTRDRSCCDCRAVALAPAGLRPSISGSADLHFAGRVPPGPASGCGSSAGGEADEARAIGPTCDQEAAVS